MAQEHAAPARASKLGAAEETPTGRVLSEHRTWWGRRAATCIRSAATVCSLAQMARALGVSADRVEQWADLQHPASVTLRDVMALPPSPAEAVLVAALAQVQAARLERNPTVPALTRVLRLVTQASALASRGAAAAVDARIDDGERREILDIMASAATEFDAARRDLAGPRA